MERQREQRLNIIDMFAGHQAELSEATISEIVSEQKSYARDLLLELLSRHGVLKFSEVVSRLLQPFMLRETNVKDICVELAKLGKIENTWSEGNRKPRDESPIRLKSS